MCLENAKSRPLGLGGLGAVKCWDVLGGGDVKHVRKIKVKKTVVPNAKRGIAKHTQPLLHFKQDFTHTLINFHIRKVVCFEVSLKTSTLNQPLAEG